MIKKKSGKTKFGWITAFERRGKIFKIKFGKEKRQINSEILVKFVKNLQRFLSLKTKKIEAPYVLMGNKIQKKVWKELKKIKVGKTKSYGEIARKYNLSPRHVGKICGQNNLLLLVPCHRVIKSDGSLGGFSSPGGLKLKKKLLQLEALWR